MQEKSLRGSFMGSNHFKVDIPMYLQFARAGLLQLDELVTAEYSLETINAGFDALASGKEIRVVVRIGEESK
jgi:S-(hydroxymethyl)glutathione dehydrogenase/alcohol dehydrogenase